MREALTLLKDYRVPGLEDRRFNSTEFWNALTPYVSDDMTVEDIGTSVEGRRIRAIHVGAGPVRVLLWSQMHGNESTASMSLADLVRFLAQAETDPRRQRILRELTVSMIPMLNPDGAQTFQRHNALGVDVNRDALRLATPEGQALKALRDRLKPEFGFNLHDQGARTTVGEGGEQVGIALLAPAYDESREYDAVRSRARLVASVLAEAMAGEISGRVAKYDDTFEPRAFGDNMQAWGTSTVLIESGALDGDPAKQRLRELNAAGLLVAMDSIAQGTYRSATPGRYDALPFNERLSHDVVLRGGHVVMGDGRTFRLDLGLTYEHSVEKLGLRLGEIGDLSSSHALEEIDVSKHFIHVRYTDGDARDGRLVRESPVALTVTSGESPNSPKILEFLGTPHP